MFSVPNLIQCVTVGKNTSVKVALTKARAHSTIISTKGVRVHPSCTISIDWIVEGTLRTNSIQFYAL